MEQITSVLVVTKDNKISSLIGQMLVAPIFEVAISSDFNDARRRLSERNYKIIIVDSGDGSDIDFAIDISEMLSVILLLSPEHLFDQISYKVEPYGILTLTRNFDAFYFYNMIKISLAVDAKIERISSQTVKLKEKMEEIRIVNRAKMILMQTKGLTENEAHKFIEKTAMDECTKKIVIAERIVEKGE